VVYSDVDVDDCSSMVLVSVLVTTSLDTTSLVSVLATSGIVIVCDIDVS